MKLKDYLRERRKTDNVMGTDVENILHMLIGLMTEIDEFEDCQSHEITDEAGDILWYLYKPLSMNKDIFSTSTRFNKIEDCMIELNKKELKERILDTYKKVRYQEHDINTTRKDGYTHLELIMHFMHYCKIAVDRKIAHYGLDEAYVFEKNIQKLRNRYDNGGFDADKSMDRRVN